VPVLLSLFLVSACGTSSRLAVYHDPNYDFGAVRIVAVAPFENLTRETLASNRVRDVFMNMLLSTGAVYVLPAGEVARGLTRAGLEKQQPFPRKTPYDWGILELTPSSQGSCRVRRGALRFSVVKRHFHKSSDAGDTDWRVVWTHPPPGAAYQPPTGSLAGRTADGRRHPGCRDRGSQ
jgi:hypothetical protein